MSTTHPPRPAKVPPHWFKELRQLGVKIYPRTKWVPRTDGPGNRKVALRGTVSGIEMPLTDSD